MIAPQLLVVAILLHWGLAAASICVAALLVAQLALMVRLLRQPKALAPWYNATGTTLYVLGMLASAVAIGHFA
jgi:chlorophyll synthase